MKTLPTQFYNVIGQLFTALTSGFSLIVILLYLLGVEQLPIAQAAPPVHSLHSNITISCDVAELIGAINNANATSEPDTIVLEADCTYILVDPMFTIDGTPEITSTFGKAGLPAITTTIIISGNGATIQRDLTATNNFTGSFRLLTVGQGGDLTLLNLTLRNGLAQGGDGSNGSWTGAGAAAGMGGAIFNNRGHLALDGVTLVGNVAQGGDGGFNNVSGYPIGLGGGGGVGEPGYVGGNSDSAGGPNGGIDNGGCGSFGGGGVGNGGGKGGFGGGGGGSGEGGFGGGGGGFGGYGGFGAGGFDGVSSIAGGGGGGFGGAIFNLTGTLQLTNSTIYNNIAQGGGNENYAGGGFGGAIFNLNGTAIILNSTLVSNTVASGSSSTPVSSDGSGVYSLGHGELYEDYWQTVSLNENAQLIISNTVVANNSGSNMDCVVSTYNNGISYSYTGCNSVTTVPISGGIVSPSPETTIVIGSGVFTETVSTVYKSQVQPSAPTTGYGSVGIFYELEAYDSNNQPVQPQPGQSYTITLTYHQEDVPTNVDEAELTLYYWDGSRWMTETTSIVFTETNTIIATPDHFSLWAVLAKNSTSQIFLPVLLKE